MATPLSISVVRNAKNSRGDFLNGVAVFRSILAERGILAGVTPEREESKALPCGFLIGIAIF